jgi:FkbM family methyltransferase
MRKNIALNNCTNIHTFQQAVAATKADLFLDETDWGNSGAAHVSDTGSPIIAAPVTVSDIRAVGPYDDIYVKIDIEGYEMSVLQGLRELFAAGLIRKLIIEIDDVNLNKFGTDSRQIYEFLDQHGFKSVIGLTQGHYGEVFVEK